MRFCWMRHISSFDVVESSQVDDIHKLVVEAEEEESRLWTGAGVVDRNILNRLCDDGNECHKTSAEISNAMNGVGYWVYMVQNIISTTTTSLLCYAS